MNRNQKIWFVFAVLVAAVIVLIVALVVSTKPAGKEPFNIALATWVGFGPFYIAEENGYFNEEGIEVSLSTIDNQAARRAALSSGKLQAMVDTLDSLANGLPAGLKAKCVIKIDESYGGDGIVVTRDINSFQDLKGKTIAYQKGLPPEFFLLYLLKKNGLSPKDIKSVDMEASAAAGAFIAKKVDAAVTWEPWLSQAGKSEHGKILVTSKEAPGLITDILVVRPDVLAERTSDVCKVLRAWFKALDFFKSNPDEAAQIVGKRLGLPSEEVQGMLTGLRFASYQDNLEYFGVEKGENVFDKVFTEAIAVWVEEGSVPKTALEKEFKPSSPAILKGLMTRHE